MKIITFQHKNILKELNDKNIYRVSIVSKYYKRTPNCYKILANKLEENSGKLCDIPIFSWQQVYRDKVISIEQIDRMLEMTGFDYQNYLCFVLDVPDNIVLLTSFYDFVDARCLEEGIEDNIPGFTWDSVYDIDNKDEIQSILPYIKKEWIKEIYKIERKERKYNSITYNYDYFEGEKINIKENNI